MLSLFFLSTIQVMISVALLRIQCLFILSVHCDVKKNQRYWYSLFKFWNHRCIISLCSELFRSYIYLGFLAVTGRIRKHSIGTYGRILGVAENGDVLLNLAFRVSLPPGRPHENEISCMSCTQTSHDYVVVHSRRDTQKTF